MDIRNLVLKIVIDALLNLAGKRIRKIERIEGCIRRFLQITNLFVYSRFFIVLYDWDGGTQEQRNVKRPMSLRSPVPSLHICI